MFRICRIASTFSKVKNLKIEAQATKQGVKVNSLTQSESWQTTNALETLLGALAGCQTVTLRALTKYGKIKVKNIKFNRIESSYNIENFKKGGIDNKINEVFVDAEIETTGTQSDLDDLHKKVVLACPVYQIISGSGIKITSNWKNIQVQ